MNLNPEENDSPLYLRTLKVHKDTISQIIFNPNKYKI